MPEEDKRKRNRKRLAPIFSLRLNSQSPTSQTHSRAFIQQMSGACCVPSSLLDVQRQRTCPHRIYNLHSGSACIDFRAFDSSYVFDHCQIINKVKKIIYLGYVKNPKSLEKRKQLFQNAFRKRLIKS